MLSLRLGRRPELAHTRARCRTFWFRAQCKGVDMFFRRKKGQRDPEMIRIEEQCRVIEEARNCKRCDDYGVVVELVKYAHDPENTRTEYRQCECGAPVHPNLKKYIKQEVA